MRATRTFVSGWEFRVVEVGKTLLGAPRMAERLIVDLAVWSGDDRDIPGMAQVGAETLTLDPALTLSQLNDALESRGTALKESKSLHTLPSVFKGFGSHPSAARG